jgi:hypothetical protein
MAHIAKAESWLPSACACLGRDPIVVGIALSVLWGVHDFQVASSRLGHWRLRGFISMGG